jgi:hypothetical protein
LTAEGHCEEIQHGYVESFNQFDAVTVFFGKTLNVVFKIVDERNGHPNTIRSDQEQRSVLKFRRNGGQSCQGFAGDAVLAKQLIESRSRRRKRGERRQGLIEYGKWFRAELGENHLVLTRFQACISTWVFIVEMIECPAKVLAPRPRPMAAARKSQNRLIPKSP